jgi:hypothetical protein
VPIGPEGLGGEALPREPDRVSPGVESRVSQEETAAGFPILVRSPEIEDGFGNLTAHVQAMAFLL